jgi:hypothetical protein
MPVVRPQMQLRASKRRSLVLLIHGIKGTSVPHTILTRIKWISEIYNHLGVVAASSKLPPQYIQPFSVVRSSIDLSSRQPAGAPSFRDPASANVGL